MGFKVLDQSIDTTTPQGRFLFQKLGAFAEFETSLRKERRMEGIAKAKERGESFGRPKTVDEEAVRVRLLTANLTPAGVAKELGSGRSTTYRIARTMKEEGLLSE